MSSVDARGDAKADPSRAGPMLGLVGLALILSMTTWFSATAILADLTAVFGLSQAAASWLTNALQLGFVVGALGLSVTGLADVLPPRALMVGACLLAAAANLVPILVSDATSVFASRAVTGLALAGVYPPALKVIASWFKRGRGLAMGAAVGALTLGSSGPYFVRALGGHFDWRIVIVVSSLAALAAAAILLTVHEGPEGAPPAPFDPRRIGTVVRDVDLSLANLGYFGHMWELYAMWGWFLAFAAAAERGTAHLPVSAATLTFLVIAIGALGCLAGGWLADRIGRPATAGAAMIVSGACALGIGLVFAGPAWLFVAVALVWGVTVIADSAQFSAMVTELSEPATRGTALALQIGVGFVLTIVSIRLTPLVAALIGWRWTFVLLVPGPAIGALAMLALKRRLDRHKTL